MLLLPVGAYLALQVPVLQTWGVGKIANALSERLGAEVSVGKVSYVFFNKLIVNDITIMSSDIDTLAGCRKLSATFNPKDFLSSKFNFTRLNLSDGVFNINYENLYETNLDRIFGRKEPKDSNHISVLPDISIGNLNLKNFRFALKNTYTDNKQAEAPEDMIDFADLGLSDININMKMLRLAGDTIVARINQIGFRDKSGFTVDKLAGDLLISAGKAQIDDLYISDGYSEIFADYFYMGYNSIADFKNFVNNVTMGISLRHSALSFTTLGRFAENLREIPLKMRLTGVVSGTVSNLRTDNLEVLSESGGTFIDIRARLSGLPKSSETMAFVDVNDCRSSISELQSILYSVNGNIPVKLVENLSPFVTFSFQGRLAGLLDDFVANGTLKSNIGNLYLDALLRRNAEKQGLDLIGNLNPESFNIGALIKNKFIGELSMNTTLSALLRNQRDGGSRYMIDSLHIKTLNLMGYPYTNISAMGSYLDNIFDGKVIVRDPNLDMLFQGIFGFSTKNNSYYDFYSEVIYADLNALNINKRDSTSVISFQALANFNQNLRGYFDGAINIRQLRFTNESGSYPIGDISVQSRAEQNNFTADLRSGFANAKYHGNDFITNFIDKLSNIVLHNNLDAVFPSTFGDPADTLPKNYSMEIDFKDMRYVTLFALPGLNIANNSLLKIDIDEQHRVSAQIVSDRIGYKNISVDNFLLELGGDRDSISSSLFSDRIMLDGINLDSTSSSLKLHNNILEIGLEYRNKSRLENRLDFVSSVNFIRLDQEHPPIIDLTISPSIAYLNGQLWNINKARVIKQDSTFVFHDVSLFSGDQYLDIDGIISANPQDTLSVEMNGIDISAVNSIMSKPLGLYGNFTGYAYALDLYHAPQILFDLKGNDVKIFDKDIGELYLKSEWDNAFDHFSLKALNSYEGRVPLEIGGSYSLAENKINLDARIDSLRVDIFESMLSGIFSKSSGTFSGNLNLAGSFDKLSLTSRSAFLNNVGLTVDFTNVPYTINGPVVFNDQGVLFNNVDIADRGGNTGRITGGIEYAHFKDFHFNTNINFANLEAINLDRHDNPGFYGTGYGTGRLNISGPLSRINLEVSLTTNENTTVHIPAYNNEISKTNLLSFTPPHKEDILQHPVPVPAEKSGDSQTELEVGLTLDITPDAAIILEIDESLGDITGYGTGLINIDVNPLRDVFNIRGDYNIQRGLYKFILQGLLERGFNIQEGGNIHFNGDIMNTELNLAAIYTTKASVSTLLSEGEDSDASIRRNVDCLVNISGPFMNPNLSFDIDIPDIDPITSARVNAVLNNEDQVTKQVMALLISGGFIPGNVASTSIVNNSSILYSNATEILSNQINKIFNQLDIPLDLSFNYLQGQGGRDLFDAAVSTQLFNNRVVINGNIGNSDYGNREMVGDLDIEFKIDEKGRLRLKAFSHSADNYSSYLDKVDNSSTQRSGVGLVYQEDFSSFNELFNRIFRRRKQNLVPNNDRSPQ